MKDFTIWILHTMPYEVGLQFDSNFDATLKICCIDFAEAPLIIFEIIFLIPERIIVELLDGIYHFHRLTSCRFLGS